MSRFRRVGPFALAVGAFLLAGALVNGAFWALRGLVHWGGQAPGEIGWLAYLLGAGLVLAVLALPWFVAERLLRPKLPPNEPKSTNGGRRDARPGNPGTDFPTGSQSVLVYINGGWQPALLVERTAAGAYVVYVPHAPDADSGAIYVVEAFQVTPLNIPARRMREIIRQAGKGLSGYAGELFATG